MKDYGNIYKKELVEKVIPFWEKNSIDNIHGGFFSCLTREGKVFDTDKFVWLQGRAVYTFSMLYNQLGGSENWKEYAAQGSSFLRKYGADKQGNFYFSLTREGFPLIQPYNIFSDCFAALGFGAFHKISGDDVYGELAKKTFDNILKRRESPKGVYSKAYPGTRDLKNFSLPMILSNLSIELDHMIPSSFAHQLHDQLISEVMDTFYNAEFGLILENVQKDGSFSNSFEGRLFNPGHVLEAMWFLMDIALLRNDHILFDRAKNIAYQAYEKGKDQTHGGIFYFLDVLGFPPQQLEWNQKLWWVHLEAMVCMAKIYENTLEEKALNIFEELHDYCWKYFRDPDYGEWFGYLNRDGSQNLTLKGGKWKGFFHVPRALLKIHQSFAAVENKLALLEIKNAKNKIDQDV